MLLLMMDMSTPNLTLQNITSEDTFIYPLPRYVYTILGMCLSITFSLGFVMNFCSLMCFLKFKNLRSVTNMFIMSLILSDFGMSAFGTPLAMTSNWAGRWLWGEYGCTYEGFMVYFLGLTQMYNLAAISLDRYIVIAKPLHSAKITHRVAGLAIACCWLGGLFWTAMPILGWNRYARDVHGTSCTVVLVDPSDPGVASYNMAIFFACLILPLFCMLYGYYGVFMTLRSVTRGGVWDMKSRVAKKNLKIEKKMAKTIGLMIGVYLGSWAPYTTVHFWAVFGDAESIPKVASGVAAITAKSAAIWNPLVYVATNKVFRIAFYKMLPCGGLTASLIQREEKAVEESDADDDDDDHTATNNKVTAVAPTESKTEATNVG